MRGARQADVVLLEDDSCSTVPREAMSNAAYWGKWVHAQFDPKLLAEEARHALANVAPCVSLSA